MSFAAGMLTLVITGLVAAGGYFVYKFFEPEIRYRKVVTAYKIGLVYKSAKDKDIDLDKYKEKEAKPEKTLGQKIEDDVSKDIEKDIKVE